MAESRSFYWAIAALLSLAAALLVLAPPLDTDNPMTTRPFGSLDPLQSSVLLRFNVDALMHDPLSYHSPPFLYPDPNPMRGTEPIISESLLAVPLRIVLGDRPALVFTALRILTLVLLALFTTLLLRELSVRPSLALTGGLLSVLISTTVIFTDRIQDISLQWVVLALFFAAKVWKGGRLWHLVGFCCSCFLAVCASMYTTAMLLVTIPFLTPLLITQRGRGTWIRSAKLALAGMAASLASLAFLWPWITNRWDLDSFLTPVSSATKMIKSTRLIDAAYSPPEFEQAWSLVWPPSIIDGYSPGAGPLLALLALGAMALIVTFRSLRSRGIAKNRPQGLRELIFRSTKFIIIIIGGFLAAVAAAVILDQASIWFSGFPIDAALWILIVSWCLRLAIWPNPWSDSESAMKIIASAAYLAALILFLLSMGSPAVVLRYEAVLLQGIFEPLSRIALPLNHLRELRRCLMLTGWTFVFATALSLERRVRHFPKVVPPILAIAVLALSFGGFLGIELKTVNMPSLPDGYELIRRSKGQDGLLELPYTRWNQIYSVRRMYLQPSHGRPIVSGYTGFAPGWYRSAHACFNSFPSPESLFLIRAWNIDTVLIGPGWPRTIDPARRLPRGVVFRGRRGNWMLFDIRPGRKQLPHVSPPDSELVWTAPLHASAEDSSSETFSLASDGSVSVSDAAIVTDPQGIGFRVPYGKKLRAVELDYGRGELFIVPLRVRVMGLVRGQWRDLTVNSTGRFLRARAADLLMQSTPAKLIINIRSSEASEFRLVASNRRWHLPELRLCVED